MTREQVDALAAEMSAQAREAGRRIAEATLSTAQIATLDGLPSDVQDMRARASIMLDRRLWAELVLGFDEDDRLADCDRSDLVAEAIFIKAGS